MTLASTTPKEIKNGNDVTTVFSFTFVINQSSDLVVTHTDADGVETVLTEGSGTTNYSVSVSNYPGTGSITYPATLGTELATGEKLTLARVVDLDQDTDLQNQGAYKPETVESALDYGRMVDLQQQEQIDRSIKAPISDSSGADYTLPTPTANAVIGIWNADADAIVAGPTANEISNAQTYASNASASASAASGFKDDAETAATAAAASFDSFDDRYLGAKSSDPSVDNDGDALVTGALYFNSTSNNMRVYNGASWDVIVAVNASAVTYDGTTSGLSATDAQAAIDEIVAEQGALALLDTVSAGEIDDNAVTLAKMAGGTAGNVFAIDASGDPAHVATGTAGQVLTSNGAGAAPTMQDLPAGMSSASSLGNSITANATITFAHGMGAKAKQVMCTITCTDAGGDAGYTQGQEIVIENFINQNGAGGGSYGCTVFLTSTNANVELGASYFLVKNPTTEAIAVITNTKWEFNIYVIA